MVEGSPGIKKGGKQGFIGLSLGQDEFCQGRRNLEMAAGGVFGKEVRRNASAIEEAGNAAFFP